MTTLLAGRRTLAATEFFKSYRKTALEAGELIVEIRAPLPTKGACFWFKQSRRVDDDISIVNASVVISLGEDQCSE